MRKKSNIDFRAILFFLGLVIMMGSIVILAILTLILRLKNPQLTETQIFLWTIREMWPLLVSAFVGFVATLVGMK